MSTLQGNTTTIENLLRSVNNLPSVGADDAVLYIDQTLTDAQKAQARTNIGAASAEEVAGKMDKVTGTPDQVVGFDEAGNPVAREAPSGGGGSVQPDWNQTDETAADFIKNKPFGDVETVLYEGANLEVAQDGEMYVIMASENISFDRGNKYIVVIDGVEYVTGTFDYYGTACLGNPAMFGLGADNGMPFVAMAAMGEFNFAHTSPFNSLSISVIGATPIDPRYVPRAVRVFYSFESVPHLYIDKGLSTKATKEDILNAQYFYVAYVVGGIVSGYYAFLIWTVDPTHGYVRVKLADDSEHYTAEYTA